jgi:hypothetical protein
VTLKRPSLNPVVQSLIGEVDAEVIEGIGSAGHVLGARKVEEADESGKIIAAQTLVDVLIQPSEEQQGHLCCRMHHLGQGKPCIAPS